MNDPSVAPAKSPVGGKYDIVRLLGRGGMGSVWEGVHTTLGTRVAIKFIEHSQSGDDGTRARFDTEARAAARIQSKYAIQIFDHGISAEGTPYIVMEMLVGEPLDARLDRVGRLSLGDTAQILSRVARGLARAHEQGVVHRDLKPENIFLSRSNDDDEEVPKVLDFGIAKMRDPSSMGAAANTRTGALVGTPFYMSPEQARGLRTVDFPSDIWSIGVIAYRAVTGMLPFDGESVGDLLVKVCTAPFAPPSSVVPGLPPAFDAWMERSLQREPSMRFASVTEQADALLAADRHRAESSLGDRARGGASFDAAAVAPTIHPNTAPPVLFAPPAAAGFSTPVPPGFAPAPAGYPTPQGYGYDTRYSTVQPRGASTGWILGIFGAILAVAGGVIGVALYARQPSQPNPGPTPVVAAQAPEAAPVATVAAVPPVLEPLVSVAHPVATVPPRATTVPPRVPTVRPAPTVHPNPTKPLPQPFGSESGY